MGDFLLNGFDMDSDVGKPAPGDKMTDAHSQLTQGLNSLQLCDDDEDTLYHYPSTDAHSQLTQGLSSLLWNGLEVGFSTTQCRTNNLTIIR